MLSRNGFGADDPGVVSSYWEWLKQSVSDLVAMPGRLALLRGQLNQARVRTTDPIVLKAINASDTRLLGMSSIANKVYDYVRKYTPSWTQAEAQGSAEGGVGGFGFLPLVLLGAGAVTALTFVFVKGTQLLKDYEVEKNNVNNIVGLVASGQLTESQGKALMVSARTPVAPSGGGWLDKLVGSFSTGVGQGVGGVVVPILMVAGVAAWFVYGPKARRD